MKHLRFWALLLAVTLSLTFAACGGTASSSQDSSAPADSEPEDPNWPVEIGGVSITEKPERVVSLSPALTEVIYELDAQDALVGVSSMCDYPDDVRSLQSCGSPQIPDISQLQDLRPRLVFVSSPLTQQDTVAIQQMNADVVVLPHVDTFDELSERYETIATLLLGSEDGPDAARRVFGELQDRLDALRDNASAIETKKSGIYLRMTPLMIATGDTFEGELLEDIGIENDAAEFTGWIYPTEKAVELYPDVIFYDVGLDASYLTDNLVYNTTDAVKNGACYEINALAFERQSGRMLDELERMFYNAYPEA